MGYFEGVKDVGFYLGDEEYSSLVFLRCGGVNGL